MASVYPQKIVIFANHKKVHTFFFAEGRKLITALKCAKNVGLLHFLALSCPLSNIFAPLKWWHGLKRATRVSKYCRRGSKKKNTFEILRAVKEKTLHLYESYLEMYWKKHCFGSKNIFKVFVAICGYLWLFVALPWIFCG